MAEAATSVTPSLSEQYLLKENVEKADVVSNLVELKEDVKPETAVSEEKVAEAPIVAAEEKTDDSSGTAASEEKTEDSSDAAATEESTETPPAENSSEDAPAVDAESTETAEEQKLVEQEAADETPEIKLETAPADFRFPTTNQTRHCFTRYIEYHRCIAAKGEGAPECDKFAKYYRSLCPGEWIVSYCCLLYQPIERWNEQRENGTFPGPL